MLRTKPDFNEKFWNLIPTQVGDPYRILHRKTGNRQNNSYGLCNNQ